jgi:hypothetical protein
VINLSSSFPRLSSECGTVCNKLLDYLGDEEDNLGDEEDNLGDEEDKFITNNTTLGRL